MLIYAYISVVRHEGHILESGLRESVIHFALVRNVHDLDARYQRVVHVRGVRPDFAI